jgi:hypothetical protein
MSKITLLGQDAAILVEVAHVDWCIAGHAEAYSGHGLPLDAAACADTPGVVHALVCEVGRVD